MVISIIVHFRFAFVGYHVSLFKKYVENRDTPVFIGYRSKSYYVSQMGYLTYDSQREVGQNQINYGRLDSNTGIFKVAIAGTYLLCFEGKALASIEGTQVSLFINGVSMRTSETETAEDPDAEDGLLQLSISELVDLKADDEVRIVITSGELEFSQGTQDSSQEGNDNNPVWSKFVGYFIA